MYICVHNGCTKTFALFFSQPHVKLADESVCVGTAQARDSYLRMDRIIQAIQDTGAQVSSLAFTAYNTHAEDSVIYMLCIRVQLYYTFIFNLV